MNPVMLTAGAMGACLVFAIAWLIPQVGAGPFFVILLTGQMISAMVICHFGWLGSPVNPLDIMKVSGAVADDSRGISDDEIGRHSLSFRVPRSAFPVLVPRSENEERGTGNAERGTITHSHQSS